MKRLCLLPLVVGLICGAGPLFVVGKDRNSCPVFNVTDYGAIGDGRTKNTEAIKKTIESCSGAGGGTVWVPAGKFLTGPIELKSNVTLHIDSGAHLLFSQDAADYPTVQSRWYGTEQHGFMACIFARDSENVVIAGGGVIDGQGEYWWRLFEQEPNKRPEYIQKREAEIMKLTREKLGYDQSRFGRPPLVQFRNCRGVRIEGVTLLRSGFWVLAPLYCDNVVIDGVSVISPPDSPNTDALDIDSCTNVRVSNSYFAGGDDCVVIKSGKDAEGRRVNRPSENIVVTNCIMAQGHGGLVIGSEMSAGVRNVAISNCIFNKTDRGIRLKSCRGRGGLVEQLQVNNIIMKDVMCPFTINMFYFQTVDNKKEKVNEDTPVFRNIHFSNITVRGANYGGFFAGLAEMPLENISFDNVYIEADKGRLREKSGGTEEDYNRVPVMADGYDITEGFFCRNVKNIRFNNVAVVTKKGPDFIFEDIEGLQIDGFNCGSKDPNAPAIELKRVKSATIKEVRTGTPGKVKVRIEGQGSEDIRFDESIKQTSGAVMAE